jgi:hypothetical protein
MATAPKLALESSGKPKGLLHRLWNWVYRRPETYEKPYSRNLLAIYQAHTLKDDVAIQARIEELKQEEKTPEIACELELLNLRTVDATSLPQIVTQLRRRWGGLSGEPVDQQAPPNNDPAALRAEAALLLANIHGFYSLQQVFNAQKRWILFWMFLWFAVATGILGVWIINKPFKYAVLALMLVGIMGGYTSSFMRIYQIEAGKDLVASIQILRSGIIGLIVKPLLGGIFAILLHLLFLSNAFSGGMFPSVTVEAKDHLVHFSDFFYGTIQGTPADFAKLLIWCFIAGFIERFVPDKLTALAENAKTPPAAAAK